ncbi:hypothetical protein Tco_0916437 [Tanacetum coccineum]
MLSLDRQCSQNEDPVVCRPTVESYEGNGLKVEGVEYLGSFEESMGIVEGAMREQPDSRRSFCPQWQNLLPPCWHKEFLACNSKEYDGKGCAVVLTHWIEKMESVHDMSGCSIDQKVKYTAGSI